jgi:hypothetical protein
MKLDSIHVDAVFDIRDTATLHKSPHNTSPVPCPPSFGNVIHMDIVFGPEVSTGNIYYIQKRLEFFFAHIGYYPKCLILDFDTKLIGGKARKNLNTLKIHMNAAPAYCIKMVWLYNIGRLSLLWHVIS